MTDHDRDKPENKDPRLKDIQGREVWVFGAGIVAAALYYLSIRFLPDPDIFERASDAGKVTLTRNPAGRLAAPEGPAGTGEQRQEVKLVDPRDPDVLYGRVLDATTD